MTTDSMREAFEQLARSVANAITEGKCWLRDCGDVDSRHIYQDPNTQHAWELFQKAALSAQPSVQSPEVKALVDDVLEYLRWREVNKHIEGGENYLIRFRKSVAPFTGGNDEK